MVEVYHVARERLYNGSVQAGDGSEAHNGPAFLPLAKAVDFDIPQGCGIGVKAIRELELCYLLLHEPVRAKQSRWPSSLSGLGEGIFHQD